MNFHRLLLSVVEWILGGGKVHLEYLVNNASHSFGSGSGSRSQEAIVSETTKGGRLGLRLGWNSLVAYYYYDRLKEPNDHNTKHEASSGALSVGKYDIPLFPV